MGQKIHPIGFRIGVIRDWESKWFYDKKQYASIISEDFQIRKAIKKRWHQALISRTEIERAADRIKVTVHSARPGMIVGGRGGGKGIEELNAVVSKIINKRNSEAKVYVNVNEVRPPELDAQIVAEQIGMQLEKRISHKRAMRQAVRRAMEMRAKGIKIICSGRLGGAEMARSESEKQGKIPLHTLRADVDYGVATGFTIYGAVGIKVWIYKGDVLPEKLRQGGLGAGRERDDAPSRDDRRGRRTRDSRDNRGVRDSRGERNDSGGDVQKSRTGRGSKRRTDRPAGAPSDKTNENTTQTPAEKSPGSEGSQE